MAHLRKRVWAALCASGGHLTARELTERLRRRDPQVKQLAVERALSLFSAMGLAHQADDRDDGDSRWEIVHRGEHFHLTCESCGETRHHTDVLAEQIRSHLSTEYSFLPARIDLQVFGTCRKCQISKAP